MKGLTYQKYGGPEVLEFKDLDIPIPKAKEILVKVHAVSINPYDWHYMRGTPKFMRASSGLFAPKEKCLGNDFSGVVEAVGTEVTSYQPGDEVFGGSSMRAFAEHVTVTEEQLAHKPVHLTLEESAVLSIAGLTAWQSLLDYGNIKKGDRVLINGASGGVGVFLVAFAKTMGAEVVGVCSAKNIELIKSLGADQVIDYTARDLNDWPNGFDVVFDVIGNLTLKNQRQLLVSHGKSIVIGFTTLSQMMSNFIFGKLGSKKVDVVISEPDGQDYLAMKAFMEKHKIKPVISKIYPFDELPQAIDYLEQGHAVGKVLIQL